MFILNHIRSMSLVLILIVSFSYGDITAQDIEDKERERIERLEMLADIWGKVYLFHPNIVRSDLDIDWNKALIDAIPNVEAAKDTDELVDVLNNVLLKTLDDPFTVAWKSEKEAFQKENLKYEITYKKLSNTVGFTNEPSLVPPVSTVAPFDFASSIHSITRIASASVIIGPISVSSSIWNPVLYLFVLATNLSRKSL